MTEIKKVIQNIYKFNLSNCSLINGEEMMVTDSGNEFVNTFVQRDFDKGIIVTPSGYNRGLVYKSIDGGMFYSPARWMPDMVTFNFNFYGLKKNAFYRIIVKAKNMSKFNSLSDVTSDRSLQITNDAQMMIMNEDLSDTMDYNNFTAIFRASSVEENLSFKIGKIGINDIIVDEVELPVDSSEEVGNDQNFEFDSGKSNIVAFGVFSCDMNNGNGKYKEVSRLTGKGINLYYEEASNEYILERDNYEDTIDASFIGANYVIDINTNKAPYASHMITNVVNDVSPNTLRQGFIRFQILESGKPVKYNRSNGRVAITVTRIL